MTRDEILNMEAGKKLDAKIEMEVFGWPRAYDDFNDIPNYSTDISAAWEVVEKMMIWGDVFIEWWQDNEWFVTNKPMGVRDNAINTRCDGRKNGKPSAPLAICRAALLVVMEE